jgi:hypothetical protein
MEKHGDVRIVVGVPFNEGTVRYLTMRTPFNEPMNDTNDVVAKRCDEVGGAYAVGLEKHLRSKGNASLRDVIVK